MYEPFDFPAEFARAVVQEVCPGIGARVVTFETLLQMKRAAARPHDLIDIEELQRGR